MGVSKCGLEKFSQYGILPNRIDRDGTATKVLGGKMKREIVRLMVGAINNIGIFVEPMARTTVCDGPYELETICIRVVNEHGHTFTTQDLERMTLPGDHRGAHEIGMLCSRRSERICLEYFSKGMPSYQGKFLLMCAKMEESGALRVTFTITCHNSSQE